MICGAPYKRREQQRILVEDEGKLIGRVYRSHFNKQWQFLLWSLSSKISNLNSKHMERGYQIKPLNTRSFGSEGTKKLLEYLISSVYKIRKNWEASFTKKSSIVLKPLKGNQTFTKNDKNSPRDTTIQCITINSTKERPCFFRNFF